VVNLVILHLFFLFWSCFFCHRSFLCRSLDRRAFFVVAFLAGAAFFTTVASADAPFSLRVPELREHQETLPSSSFQIFRVFQGRWQQV
jgi:hypothetical protein